MATASQSCIVRFWQNSPHATIEHIAETMDRAGIEVTDRPPTR